MWNKINNQVRSYNNKRVEIPEGFRFVDFGIIKKGDLYLDALKFPQIVWDRVSKEDIGQPVKDYFLIIRAD